MRFTKLKIDGALPSGGKTRVKLAFAVGVLFIAAAMMSHAAFSSNELPKPGDIILQFESPGSSPCGLAWDGTHLWMADNGTDTIYKLDPSDGSVLSSFKSPGSQPRGLVWDGTHLRHADNATRKLYKLDRATGAVLSAMDAPATHATTRVPELGGLTWDGEHLWCGTVDGWSSRMNEMDPSDGSLQRFFFTKGYPRALATDGTFIWNATDNGGHRVGLVYKYKLSDGLFVSQFDTPGFYPTGLAFDGEYLWCVDRETKTIYKLAAN
jgi:outer membrane protein assembly factor BamB